MNQVVLISIIVILLLVFFYFKKEEQLVEEQIKKEKKNIALAVIVNKARIKAGKDSLAKNILSNVELGLDVAGCFVGFCGAGSKTIGKVSN